MNLYVPSAYDERIFRLAFGLEPVDAVLGTRVLDGLRVTFDEHPKPLDKWRRWMPGEVLDDALPTMTRHGSGRFVRIFEATTETELSVRITDPRRRYVPRKFKVTVPSETDVITAEADPAIPDIPAAQRVLQAGLFPAASYNPAAAGTAIRGRVNRNGIPVRWVRALAEREGTTDVLGWAHGDDRGEFMLPVTNPVGQVGFLDNPISVTVTVGFRSPAPLPDPTDPLVPDLDPIWDLLEETVTPPVADETVTSGRRFPPTYNTQVFSPAFQLTLGRTRSIEFALP